MTREDRESIALERLALEALDALRETDPKACKAVIWRAIAAGVLSDEDTLRWTRSVAPELVREVIDKKDEPEKRPRRALEACRLARRTDDNRIERSALKLMVGWEKFRALLMGVVYTPPPPAAAAKMLIAEGYYEGLTVRQVTNRVGKWDECAEKG